MYLLLAVILTLTITSPATMGAKLPATKRGLEESLGYNQQNQLFLLPSPVNHIHPYRVESNGIPTGASSLGGHGLNLLEAQLQDYSLSSSNIGDYTALPVSNFQPGNIAPASAQPSPTVKPLAPVSVPPTPTTSVIASQQVQPQPQSPVIPAAAPDPATLFTAARPAATPTVAAAPATFTVPAVASATLQLQVPAQIQTVQSSSVQQQAAPAPVQTSPVVQNVETSTTAPASVNTQQVQQQIQNIQQNVPQQSISSSQVNQVGQQSLPYGNIQNLPLYQAHGGLEQNFANLVQGDPSIQFAQQQIQNIQQNVPKQSTISSPQVNQVGQQSLSYGNIQNLPSNQAHGGLEQNIANLVQSNPSIQFAQQQSPVVKYVNTQTFPLNQQYIGLQQGIYGNLLNQKSLFGSYNLNDQTLAGLKYENLNSGFNGLNFNANLLSYKGY